MGQEHKPESMLAPMRILFSLDGGGLIEQTRCCGIIHGQPCPTL